MATISSLSFASLGQASERRVPVSATQSSFSSNSDNLRCRTNSIADYYSNNSLRTTTSSSRMVVQCMSSSAATDLPTVAETKSNFLKAYKRPIPSVYNTVLQELIVQHHLMRYKTTYRYDPVFALGFVTVYDQLMDGYPLDDDRVTIFKAYIQALNEDPEQYRNDAGKLEEWARAQNATSLLEFQSKEGDIEGILKDISERAGSKGSFSYTRFFAIGLFRLLELANVTDPTVLEKLCAALKINKRSVDRDLDVYRNLLSKLVQAKELIKEYVNREKKKREERAESQKANGAVTNA